MSFFLRDNRRALIFADNEPIEDANSTRVSLRGGLFWDQSIGPLHIIPEVSYDYGITPVRSGSDWYVHSINVTLDVMLEL